ncbi:MAG: hypothetical protein JO013_00725 [Alphaproteobacteria bacterium]|nr:hypothetical protein [Alphaproteobacteria bacterium]
MTKPIIASAREIAADLRAHENDVDATLAGQARLISRLIEARKSAGLPAMVGAEIVDQAIAAVSQCGELRRTVRGIHASLAAIDIRAVGDESDCPVTGAASLAVVATSEAKSLTA